MEPPFRGEIDTQSCTQQDEIHTQETPMKGITDAAPRAGEMIEASARGHYAVLRVIEYWMT